MKVGANFGCIESCNDPRHRRAVNALDLWGAWIMVLVEMNKKLKTDLENTIEMLEKYYSEPRTIKIVEGGKMKRTTKKATKKTAKKATRKTSKRK